MPAKDYPSLTRSSHPFYPLSTRARVILIPFEHLARGPLLRVNGEAGMHTDRILLLAAYALFLCLTGDLLWGGYASFTEPFIPSDIATSFEYLVLAFVLPITLVACAALTNRWSSRPVPRGRHSATLGPCCAACAVIELGGVILAGSVSQGAIGMGAIVATAAALSAGCGMLFCTFQNALSYPPVRDSGWVVIGAAVVAPTLFFGMRPLAAGTRLLLDFAALVPLCCIAFTAATRGKLFDHPSTSASLPTASEQPSSLRAQFGPCWHELLQPLVYISFSAFVVGLFQAVTAGDDRLETANAIKMAGLFVSGIALLIAWRRSGGAFSFYIVYKVVFPLIATSYLLSPTFVGNFWYLAVGFSFLVFAIVSSLMVITCLQVAHNHRINAVVVYGFFAGVVYLVLACGSLLGFLFKGSSLWSPTAFTTLALLMVYLLALIRPRAQTGRTDTVPPAEPDTALREHLREAFQLSERELDVLFLLACGRDVPAIAKRLSLSENTIRTHTKSIYVKMDVHTKQELLDKLEDLAQDA